MLVLGLLCSLNFASRKPCCSRERRGLLESLLDLRLSKLVAALRMEEFSEERVVLSSGPTRVSGACRLE